MPRAYSLAPERGGDEGVVERTTILSAAAVRKPLELVGVLTTQPKPSLEERTTSGLSQLELAICEVAVPQASKMMATTWTSVIERLSTRRKRRPVNTVFSDESI